MKKKNSLDQNCVSFYRKNQDIFKEIKYTCQSPDVTYFERVSVSSSQPDLILLTAMKLVGFKLKMKQWVLASPAIWKSFWTNFRWNGHDRVTKTEHQSVRVSFKLFTRLYITFLLLLDVVGAFTDSTLNKTHHGSSFLLLLQLNHGCSSRLIGIQSSWEQIRAFSVWICQNSYFNSHFFLHARCKNV